MIENRIFIEANIVAIFPFIDIKNIDKNAIRKLAEMEKDTFGNAVFESQQGLQIILPQRKVEIAIVQDKAIVIDRQVKEPTNKDSDLIKVYFRNLNELLKPYENTYYGFNYVFQVPKKDSKKLIGKNLIDKLKSPVVLNLSIQHDNNKQLIIQKNIENDHYKIQFNYEIKEQINDYKILDNQYKEGYKFALKLINEL